MKSCPACGFQQADTIRRCARCNADLPAGAADSAGPGAAPRVDPEVLGLIMAEHARGNEAARWLLLEPVLLVLSLPILVPSLLINWLMAKRWGRIDWFLLAIDGAVLLLLSLGSPVFFLLMLVAAAASSALFVIRYPKLDQGIFLGYSDSVAWRLQLGGTLIIIGLATGIPWAAVNMAVRFVRSPAVETVESLTRGFGHDHRLRPVSLEDPSLDPAEAVFEIETPGGPQLVGRLPGSTVKLSSAGELWKQREDLLGCSVELPVSLPTDPTFERTAVETVTVKEGPRAVDRSRRLYVPVPRTGGRVWVVSEPLTGDADPVRKALASRKVHTGVPVIVFADKELGRQFPRPDGKPLPYMGVALMPSSAPVAPVKAPLWSYLPLGKGQTALWGAFPGPVPVNLEPPLAGILESSGKTNDRLAGYIRERGAAPGDPTQVRLMVCLSPWTYLERTGLLGELRTGFALSGLFWFLPGLAIVFWAIRISMEE
ncbi:MAG: hypothetical protein HY815_03070 [Candidatus Riflebacteria bacterium]|nr:hypothetical protein [Candidatus Riflebacteria bacterium]